MKSTLKLFTLLLGTILVGFLAFVPIETPVTSNIVTPATEQNTVTSPKIKIVPTDNPTPQKIEEPAVKNTKDTDLSNDNYYINSDGNQVHSPAYSNSVPSGATARCRDGTYSFSQHRRGTCSSHGGVGQWL